MPKLVIGPLPAGQIVAAVGVFGLVSQITEEISPAPAGELRQTAMAPPLSVKR